jgi:neutral ceramidase
MQKKSIEDADKLLTEGVFCRSLAMFIPAISASAADGSSHVGEENRTNMVNRRQFLATVAAAPASAQIVASSGKTGFRTGFAERDISPDIGMEEPGGYGKAYHRSFHDPCKVRAAVFDDGNQRVALVGIDSCSVARFITVEARKAITAQCGISPDAVMVGASHSHSSGPLDFVLPGEYDHAPALVQKLAYQHSTCLDPGYAAKVQREIVTAVCQADASKTEAVCVVDSGHEDKAAFNRRLRMKNGLTYTHPHQGNPDMLGPAGPIDPEVGAIGAWSPDGRFLGCIVNYSCHATTNPGGSSANWIYYLENTIRGAMGADVPVVYLQGACGDITQVDNLSPYRNPTGEQWAKLVGGRVGGEVIKVLVSGTAGTPAPLQCRSTILHIKRRLPTEDHVKQAMELVQKDPKTVPPADWTFAKETVLLHWKGKKTPVAEVEVQAIQVGPAVFVSNPAELFVEHGLYLKKRSRFPHTYVVELGNGGVGYVPTEEAFGPHGGGYETRLTSYSNLEVSAGRQMMDAGLQLVSQLVPGKKIVPPPAPPFKEDWSYGDLPPQLS